MERENLFILDLVAQKKISVSEAVQLIEVLRMDSLSDCRIFCIDEPLTIEVSLN